MLWFFFGGGGEGWGELREANISLGFTVEFSRQSIVFFPIIAVLCSTRLLKTTAV